MNYKGHIFIGGLLTILIMLLINIWVAIKENVFAKDIFSVYFPINSFEFWIITIPIIILYSIIPDIDHKKSMPTLIAYSIGVILIFIGFLSYNIINIQKFIYFKGLVIYGIVIIVMTMYFSNYVKHRGITHTLQFVILSTILLYLVGIEKVIYYIIALISVWCHLLLDKIPFKISLSPSNGHW